MIPNRGSPLIRSHQMRTSAWKAFGLLLASGCFNWSDQCLGGGAPTSGQLTLSAQLSPLAPFSLTPDSGCLWLCDAIDDSYTSMLLAAEQGACICSFYSGAGSGQYLPDGNFLWDLDGGPAFSCPEQTSGRQSPVSYGPPFPLNGYDGGNCDSAIVTSFVPRWAAGFTDSDGGSICTVPSDPGTGPAVICHWPATNESNGPTCTYPTLDTVVCTWPSSTHC